MALTATEQTAGGFVRDADGRLIVRKAENPPTKYALINATAAGDTTLVPAVAGKRIRVLSFVIVAAGAVTAKFRSGVGGSDLSGAMSFAANGGTARGGGRTAPALETAPGAPLVVNLSAAVQVGGHLAYIEE